MVSFSTKPADFFDNPIISSFYDRGLRRRGQRLETQGSCTKTGGGIATKPSGIADTNEYCDDDEENTVPFRYVFEPAPEESASLFSRLHFAWSGRAIKAAIRADQLQLNQRKIIDGGDVNSRTAGASVSVDVEVLDEHAHADEDNQRTWKKPLIVQPLPADTLSYRMGRVVYKAFEQQRKQFTVWHQHIQGSSAQQQHQDSTANHSVKKKNFSAGGPEVAVFRHKKDTASRGYVRWIGSPPQGGVFGKKNPKSLAAQFVDFFLKEPQIYCAVEWVQPPRTHPVAPGETYTTNNEHNTNDGAIPTKEDELSKKNGGITEVKGVFFVDSGRIDGCKCFSPSDPASVAAATLELPHDLLLVSNRNSTADKVYSNNKEKSENGGNGECVIPKPPRLSSALWKVCGACITRHFLCRMSKDTLWVFQPYVTKLFIDYISDPHSGQESPRYGVVIAVIFLGLLFGDGYLWHQLFFWSERASVMARNTLIALIYQKSLCLSRRALADPKYSAGKVINLVSNDVETISRGIEMLGYWFLVPFSIIGFSIQLFMFVPADVAIISLLAMMFVPQASKKVATLMMDTRKALATATDSRIKATDEMVSSIRIIKQMGWEQKVQENILRLRDDELAALKRYNYTVIANYFVSAATPVILNAVVFGALAWHTTLTSVVVFPVLAVVNNLRVPFQTAGFLLSRTMPLFVSLRRVCDFLDAPDDGEERIDTHGGVKSTTGTRTNDDEGRNNGKHAVTELAVVAQEASLSAFQAEEVEYRRHHATPGQETFYHMRDVQILHRISLEIPKGQLTLVLGATGSGKSSLLEGILGQMQLDSGTVSLHEECAGSVAYLAQQPWIMQGTVKENILFFDDFEEERYREAARMAQLGPDLAMLAMGENTEIGEKGVTLSGGQKARVALARTIYSRKQMYLFDDPLSALDAHVGRAVMEECIAADNTIIANKTRVLVTHHRQYVRLAQHVIVLQKGGDVEFSGSTAAYLSRYENSSSSLNDLLPPSQSQSQSSVTSPKVEHVGDLPPSAPAAGAAHDTHKVEDSEDGDRASKSTSAALMTQEEKAQGEVSSRMYTTYINDCGGWNRVVKTIATFVVTEIVNTSSFLWLAVWSDDTMQWNAVGLSRRYLTVYFCLSLTNIVLQASRIYIVFEMCLQGSRRMHQRMLRSVSTGTMEFFDTTPVGRIMNRFSKDIDDIDCFLPDIIFNQLLAVSEICSEVFIIVVSQAAVLALIIPVLPFYNAARRYFVAATRESQRVDALNRSPCMSLLSEIMEGSKTILCQHKSHDVIADGLYRLDRLFSTSYLRKNVLRFVGTKMTVVCNGAVGSLMFFAVFEHIFLYEPASRTKEGTKDVGFVALGVTLIGFLMYNANFFVMQCGDMEAAMNAVERVEYYASDITREEFAMYGDREAGVGPNPLPHIPLPNHLLLAVGNNGRGRQIRTEPESTLMSINNKERSIEGFTLEFSDVKLRYRRELDLVLKGVNFKVFPGQKVGIVGRTGSGKSTILLALLRIVEIEQQKQQKQRQTTASPEAAGDDDGGAILIDGKRTSDFALPHLRSFFAMIPQEPVLLNGSVRYNLDPFNECTDDEITTALEKVGMSERLIHGQRSNESDPSTLPPTCDLSAIVERGGKNFSVGERQLLSIARAMLKKNVRFILMDEATANIDQDRDEHIQHVIRSVFRDQTVITIAHRLDTIMASDVVIVLDAGRVVEMGHPLELLEEDLLQRRNNSQQHDDQCQDASPATSDSYSYFQKMVASAGSEIEARLTQMAREHYHSMTAWRNMCRSE